MITEIFRSPSQVTIFGNNGRNLFDHNLMLMDHLNRGSLLLTRFNLNPSMGINHMLSKVGDDIILY